MKNTRIFFDNGGGAILFREQADGTGKGFYFPGSPTDAKALAGDINSIDDIDWDSGARQVLTAEEIEKIKYSELGWEEEMSAEEFKNSNIPPFNGSFARTVWFEMNLTNPERIFNALDAQEYLVLDEAGNNVANASLKHFDGAKQSYVAYQDNSNGYKIHTASETKNWFLQEKE